MYVVTREHNQLFSKFDKFLLENARISAMHIAITHNYSSRPHQHRQVKDRRTGPVRECRRNKDELALSKDCTAHAVMLDPSRNTVRALWR
jgi:hypothetical protein